jgi:NifU-like protein involved in Fe-S cluster formation
MGMDFERYKRINDEKLNFRVLEEADVVHHFKNLGCGDGYVLYLKLDHGRIQDASYTTTGCGFGLVSLAMATELVKGKTVEEALQLGPDDIERAFEFPERRKNYPKVAWEAMKEALEKAMTGPLGRA